VRTISESNKLLLDARSKPSIVSFRSALLRIPGLVGKFLSHGIQAVSAGYLSKNQWSKDIFLCYVICHML